MFGRFKRQRTPPAEVDEPLILTPVPALVVLLVNLERQKGEPLIESEVNEIRDNCACVALPVSAAHKMSETRGYEDIAPEFAWEQWQSVRHHFFKPPEGK